MTQALEFAARKNTAQRHLELLAKTALTDFDLSLCEIDELAAIYDALVAVEFAWVGVNNRPRIGDNAGPEICEQEAGALSRC